MAQIMKAWYYNSGSGGIEKNLRINDNAPQPIAGDNEVLVQVHAMALNPVDFKIAESGLPLRLIGSNLVPGADFCGRVEKVGNKVDEFQTGEWVFGAKAGSMKDGTLAQYVAVSRESVAKLPEGVNVENAAGVAIVGLTEHEALVPHVKSGDKVFINGGSGGTGIHGIQIAKALGCYVTTTCSTQNVELCKKMGADEVIDYKKGDVIKALSSKGQTYQLVVDNIGNPTNLYKSSSAFLVPSGKFIQIGGPISLGGLTQIGSSMLLPSFLGGGKNSYQFLVPKVSKSVFEQLGLWMAEGKLKGVVDSVWEWEDAPKAFERLKSGRAAGKVVVKVKQEKP
ncbi:chaperonin 10-like protein [Pyrenochaeta sp. MPI-SDFR-AT-0127]|nr:chaperonin 10-like protein [Pyrenochaeta sp. MPI-SDFR-AT-0127]